MELFYYTHGRRQAFGLKFLLMHTQQQSSFTPPFSVIPIQYLEQIDEHKVVMYQGLFATLRCRAEQEDLDLVIQYQDKGTTCEEVKS